MQHLQQYFYQQKRLENRVGESTLKISNLFLL
nr:MAG TPA: hypothetical protein [Caudoviricetes sp.]